MTQFEANTARERRKLFVDAVSAHRDHSSALLTIEAECLDDIDGEGPGPWIQLADQMFNMDVTGAEFDRLKELLSEFPEFRTDQLKSPEEAEGANVHIATRSDANRLAGFADRVFQVVYGRDEGYRAWVTAVWGLRPPCVDSPDIVLWFANF